MKFSMLLFESGGSEGRPVEVACGRGCGERWKNCALVSFVFRSFFLFLDDVHQFNKMVSKNKL